MGEHTINGLDQKSLRRIATAVETDLEGLVDRIVERTREELDAYAHVPLAEHRESTLSNSRRALWVTVAGRSAEPAELSGAIALGRRRAEQGIPVEQLLQSFRISFREGWHDWVHAAEVEKVGIEAVLTVSERLWNWIDELMLAAAGAHRDTEVRMVAGRARDRSALLRDVLYGSRMTEGELAQQAAGFGLRPDEPLYPFCAESDVADAEGVEARLGRSMRRNARVVLLSVIDGRCVGVASSPPPEVPGTTIGIGTPERLGQLTASFAGAVRSLRVAMAFRAGSTASLADLSLLTAVFEQESLGDLLERRHLDPLATLRAGDALESTVAAYLRHDLRVEKTAADLFIHPNTLRNRLGRIEAVTGADLTHFEDLVEVWWALQWRRQKQNRDDRSANEGGQVDV